MRSGTRFILASFLFAAFLLIPSFSGAGESPYNPRLAQCATLPTAAAAQACAKAAAPHTTPDMSYFCVAGNVGSFHTLYISDVHHLDRAEDPNTQPAVDQAWMQAIRGQRYPYNAHCLIDQTVHISALRQSILAQPHERTVNIQWQYGQSGPAVASN
ncbi:MAG: hypothetical protein ACREPP_11035 [Rhodanobacteraceae bacterium]